MTFPHQRHQRLLTGRTGTLPASSIAALVGSVAVPQVAGQIGSGGIDNGVGSSCISAGSGDIKKCLGKDGFAQRIPDGDGINAEDRVAVDKNLVVACSLGRMPHQVRLNC